MPPKSEEAGQYSGSLQATVDSREMAKHVADLSLASKAKRAKFHGRPDSEGDVESWLRTFRRYGKALEYDDKRMLQVVPMFLGGFAATWYDCETGRPDYTSKQALSSSAILLYKTEMENHK